MKDTELMSNTHRRPRWPGRHSQPWMRQGSFNCETGRWRGRPFPIEPDIVMAVTTLMADNGGRAEVVRQVRRDNSEARLVVRLELPT